jgi:hypothetical protein
MNASSMCSRRTTAVTGSARGAGVGGLQQGVRDGLEPQRIYVVRVGRQVRIDR